MDGVVLGMPRAVDSKQAALCSSLSFLLLYGGGECFSAKCKPLEDWEKFLSEAAVALLSKALLR